MTVTFSTISIFESPAKTLVNPVNTVGVMGKGLALQFRRRYPEMFMVYKRLCDNGKLHLGHPYLWRNKNEAGKNILLFPTKEHWRNPSRLSYIHLGLDDFVLMCSGRPIFRNIIENGGIAFPKLGCGEGGLNWENEVRPSMVESLKCLLVEVCIHV